MTQEQIESSVVRVSNIHLIRWKKLRGGRLVIRALRTIKAHELKHSYSGNQHVKRMVVDFDHKYGAGQMIGVVDKEQGKVNFDAKAFIPEGYLKGRGFKLEGYNLRVNVTNVGRREPPSLKPRVPTKGPAKRGKW